MDIRKKYILSRCALVFIAFALASLLLIMRLGYLQLWEAGRYTRLAQSQRLRPAEIDARRGSIYDRNFLTLAVNTEAYAAYVMPHERRDPADAAAKLASYLSLSEEAIFQRLSGMTSGFWLERRIPSAQARAIRALQIPGIQMLRRPQRAYPQGSLAAHVLGITGVDNQGLEGIEFFYDDVLKGTPGRLARERDASQQEIPGGLEVLIPPENGHDLVLTIDRVVQYIAEREIEAAVQGTRSERGIVIVLNPNTGEILANAIYPTFDPNDYQRFSQETRRNTIVTDQYEPGSTFKIFTAAAALDQGLADEHRVFHSASSWSVGGGSVRNWNGLGFGNQSLLEAVENSDNITFAQLAVEMGPDRFHPYLVDFGFGSRTGVDFPGESRGLLPAPGQIRHGETLQWANIGFGQGVAVTPLQLAMATAAIANGGQLLKPFYVLEVRNEHGQVVQRTEPQVSKEPLQPETAELLADMMRSAVVQGTGSRADVVGFSVAGKTGTAEVPVAGGYGDDLVASFVGFAPAADPAVTVLVALHSPQTEIRYGGVLAAPVFQRVVEQTLEHLGVKRREVPPERTIMAVVPNVRNYPLNEAEASLADAALRWGYQTRGSIVMDQVPSPGSRVPPQTTVNLFFYDDSVTELVVVPDVLGLSMRDASTVTAEHGLRIRISGSGMAAKQTPRPGAQVLTGSVIEVEFLP